jgi:hypothetical protein
VWIIDLSISNQRCVIRMCKKYKFFVDYLLFTYSNLALKKRKNGRVFTETRVKQKAD